MSLFKKDDTRQQMKAFIAQLAERVASGEYDMLSCNVNPDPESNQASIGITIAINTAPVSFNKMTQESSPSERRFPATGAPPDPTRWPDGIPKSREMIAYEKAVAEDRATPMPSYIKSEMQERDRRAAEREARRAEQEDFRRREFERKRRSMERVRNGGFADPDWDDAPKVDPKFIDPKLEADPTSKIKPASQYEPSRIRPGTMVRDLIFDDEPSEPSP